jgi:hypothetical protein
MPVQKCRNEPPATCPKEYKEALEEVLTLLFSGQHGGDGDDEENDMSHRGNSPKSPNATPKETLLLKAMRVLGGSCFRPCKIATTKLEEVLDKIDALDQKEYNQAALSWLKGGLTAGGVGILMYSNGELSAPKYVLSVLERVSDSISFSRILENTMSSIRWTAEASGYSAKILIGFALAKLCVDISMELKKGVVKQLITIPGAVNARRIRTVAAPFHEHIGIQTESEERALKDAVAVPANTGRANNATNARKNNSPNQTRKASVKRRASSRRR